MSGQEEFERLVVSAFEEVKLGLTQLERHIRSDLVTLPLWVSIDNEFKPDRDALVTSLKKFDPAGSLAPQETYSCPGAVAATRSTLQLLKAINKAKDRFKALVELCQIELDKSDTKFVRDYLARAGYGVVKLKQVFRHIHAINYHPTRVAWSKARDNSSVVITPDQAEQLLQKAGQGQHIEAQLTLVKGLNKKEKLVIQRAIKPYWIVNISVLKDEVGQINQNIRTSLPLFYIHDPSLPLPDVRFAGRSTNIKRKIRSDKKVNEEAFLPSISAYQYKH